MQNQPVNAATLQGMPGDLFSFLLDLVRRGLHDVTDDVIHVQWASCEFNVLNID
jgi:hypothetical protein